MNTLHVLLELPPHNPPSDHELLPDPDVPDCCPEHAGDVLPADRDAAVYVGSQRRLNHPRTGLLCMQVQSAFLYRTRFAVDRDKPRPLTHAIQLVKYKDNNWLFEHAFMEFVLI